jgi:hypothetical protein
MPLPKSLLTICVACLALATLTLSLPKAARAVAAALVQVVNTASNPVVTQSIGQQAGQSIQIACDDGLGYCFQNDKNGGSTAPPEYTVPSGQFLVITAVDVNTTSFPPVATCKNHTVIVDGQSHSATGVVLATQNYLQYVVANAGSLHASYPSGVAFAPGLSLTLPNAIPSQQAECYDVIRMYGYLTSN